MIRISDKDNYMTIWSITEKDGRYSGRATTSRKNTKDGTYINSSWNVRFSTAAAEKAKTLKERDRIVIHPGNMSIENTPGEERPDGAKPYYLWVTIFDFDLAADTRTSATPKQNNVESDDELPF